MLFVFSVCKAMMYGGDVVDLSVFLVLSFAGIDFV